MLLRYKFFDKASYVVFIAGLIAGILMAISGFLSTDVLSFYEFILRECSSILVVALGAVISVKLSELATKEADKMRKREELQKWARFRQELKKRA